MTRAHPQFSLEDARGHENRLGLPPRSSLVHDWPPPSQMMGTRGKDIRDATSDLSCYKPWRRQRERRHLSARGFALCLQPRTNQQPSDRADDQNYCKGPGPKTGVPILRMESKGRGNVYSFSSCLGENAPLWERLKRWPSQKARPFQVTGSDHSTERLGLTPDAVTTGSYSARRGQGLGHGSAGEVFGVWP